jgi:hypothetical protein
LIVSLAEGEVRFDLRDYAIRIKAGRLSFG